MGNDLALALALEGRTEPAMPETKRLVALAERLAELPDPDIDATFAAALEARLLTEGLEEQTPVVGRPHLVAVPDAAPETPSAEPVRRAPVVPLPRRRHVIKRGFAAAVAAAMLGAFPALAAGQALPGSPFYGMKTMIERAQIAVFGGAVQDGIYWAQRAERRFGEAAKLEALGASSDVIARTIAAGNYSLKTAARLILDNTNDPAVLSKLATVAREGEKTLTQVASSIGGAGAIELTDAIGTSRRIQEAIAKALGLPVTSIVEPAVAKLQPEATARTAQVQVSAPEHVRRTASARTANDGSSPRVEEPRRPGGNNGNGGEHCEVFAQDQLGDHGAVISKVLLCNEAKK